MPQFLSSLVIKASVALGLTPGLTPTRPSQPIWCNGITGTPQNYGGIEGVTQEHMHKTCNITETVQDKDQARLL